MNYVLRCEINYFEEINLHIFANLHKSRVYAAIGHIQLDKITTRLIQKFIISLAQDGTNEITKKPLSHRSLMMQEVLLKLV